MNERRTVRAVKRLAWTILVLCLADASLAAQGRAAGLRIIVIEGEDAVNIVQQRTAVAPVVEVRDHNDLSVAGAVVKFAIRNGRATFGGARTVTVTTNAVGRAAATGLTPTGSGALQISASASFQGQTAAVTIAQTNVMTVAQATAAATASGTGSSGAGAGAGGGSAAGGGGGLSATTIGVVAGAVAAGGVVAVTAIKKAEGHVYSGRISAQESLSFGGGFCRTENLTATLTMTLTVENGSTSGTANIDDGLITEAAVSPGCAAFQGFTDSFGLRDATVSGSTSNITFFKAETNAVPPGPFDPLGTTNNHEYTFTGSFDGTTITGQIAHRRIVGGVVAGTTTFPVTLR